MGRRKWKGHVCPAWNVTGVFLSLKAFNSKIPFVFVCARLAVRLAANLVPSGTIKLRAMSHMIRVSIALFEGGGTETQSLPGGGKSSRAQPRASPQAQLLLLLLLLADHVHVAVLPHALPQLDGTAAHVLA